ncbi:MAG: amino acid adenylation domain-containing protein, partial [Chloroflexi bacterium]
MAPASPVYSIPLAHRLRGRLDVHALERALGGVVERHEALRTRFPTRDGVPVQEVVASQPVRLEVVDLGGLPLDRREAEARRLAAEEARRPFDLERGPLQRALLLRLDAQDHVLVWVVHHIVLDLWSLTLVEEEIGRRYADLVEGQSTDLAAPAMQYTDVAVWQRRALSGDVLEGQLAYWRDRLTGATDHLDLPIDRPRPAEPTDRGATLEFRVGAELAGALRALSRAHGGTLFMTLLAAFSALLSRYSGSSDITVGAPIAGRTRTEFEQVVGLFVNTVALRTDLSGDPSFVELLERVREVVLGATAHQEVPFERLVRELQPARDPGRHPLFRVMLDLESRPPALRLRGVAVTAVPLDTGTAKFDLALTMTEGPDGLAGRLEYRCDLFDEATAERIVTHLQALLTCVTADPERRLSTIPLLGERERHRLLVEWNDTAADVDAHRCIHQLVEEWAARRPDATAVVSGERSLTYAELNHGVNQLAHHLRVLGVGPEVPVGVCMERSAELVVALLGILKAGGAYVPLDPENPAERLRFMLEDCAAPVVLTRSGLVDTLPDREGTRVVRLDTDWPLIARHPGTDPTPSATAESLANVMYTSGSTGTPKGVAVEHKALANLVGWHVRRYAVGERDRGAWLAPIGFDASVWELWPYLAVGASVAVGADHIRRSVQELPRWLDEQGVTICFLATPLAEEMLTGPWPPPRRLRALLTGGDRLTARPRASSGVQVHNHYGPTECTVVATSAPVSACAAEGDDGAPPIGRPIANTRAYVLDEHGAVVPIGVAGELCIGGAAVARGYLNRPALTAERFVPDPFGGEPGLRMYRTGDRARWRADGELEFLGRLDEQVKIRGHRIEPGEVESALTRHPGVRQAVVVAREDVPGERRLVAYVIAEGEAPPDAAELRVHLRRSLPEVMVPSAFVGVEALPLTPNGKLDRAALPVPERSPADGYVAPRTAAEEVLAGIWAEVLHLERVGVEDNFFELGGDSILSIQIVTRARRAGLRLSPRMMFESQTVASLAAALERAAPVAAEQETRPVLPLFDLDAYPLSPTQEGVLFHTLYAPGTGEYVEQYCFRLGAGVDIGLLERAWSEVVRRHAILRSRVVWEGVERALQVVERHVEVPVEHRHVEGEEGFEDFLEDDRRRGFTLGEAPLLRLTLLDGVERRARRLVWTFHHLLLDGWSLPIVLSEVRASYAALTRGETPRLPAVRPYRDHIAWLEGRDRAADEEWWRHELAGLEGPTCLLADRAGEREMRTRTRRLSAATTGRLEELARRRHLTVSTILQGAWGLLLSRYTGSADVVFGMTVSGRPAELAGVESMVGLFITTVPVRVRVDEERQIAGWLGELQATQVAMRAHEHAPLVEVQGWSGLPAGAALFDTLLVYENYPVGECSWPELELHRVEDRTNYPLTVVVEPGDELTISATYDAGRFEAQTAERMLGHLERLLVQMAAAPDGRVGALDLLTEEERHRVLVEWNATGADFPADRTIHELVEEQAR